jgi:hypothetical protein
MRTRPCTTSYYLALPDITLHLLDMSYNHIACKLHRTGRCTLKLTWNEYQNGKTKSGRGSVRKTWTEWMWMHYVDTWRLDVCRTSINYRVRGMQTLFFRRFVRRSSRSVKLWRPLSTDVVRVSARMTKLDAEYERFSDNALHSLPRIEYLSCLGCPNWVAAAALERAKLVTPSLWQIGSRSGRLRHDNT